MQKNYEYPLVRDEDITPPVREFLRWASSRLCEIEERVTSLNFSTPEPAVSTNLGASNDESRLILSETKRGILEAEIRRRKTRAKFFPDLKLADPAWDMLLDLKLAQYSGWEVSVSSLCIAACVPPTTALRWIRVMVQDGYFQRKEDFLDRRRAFISLGEKGEELMDGYLAALQKGN